MLQHNRDLLKHTLAYPAELPQQEFFTLSDKTQVALTHPGVLRFEPHAPSDLSLVLSAGVHGNETAPLELVNQLVAEILAEQIQCRCRVLILFGNPEAMVEQKRELKVNLNRLFSGAHRSGNSAEHQRAAVLESEIERFFGDGDSDGRRAHYDLHTAIRDSKREKFAIYPFRHGKPWKWEQIEFLARCGVNTVLLSHNATTTFSYYSSIEFGADAFTVELGKVRPFGENDLSRLTDLKRELITLIQQEPVSAKSVNRDDITVFDVAQVIEKQTEDFAFTFADDVANFTEFERGTVLSVDGDSRTEVKAQKEAIVFPNAKVALGQRACLTVVPVGADQPFE